MGKLLDFAGSFFRRFRSRLESRGIGQVGSGMIRQNPAQSDAGRGTVRLQLAVWEQQL